MKKGRAKTILVAVGSGLLLCAFFATARAQEEVRLQTVSAYIGLQERQPVFPYISYISSQACSLDNCAVSATFPEHINHTATLAASRFWVSGRHDCTYTTNKFWGTSSAKYVMKAYAKVVPNGKLRINLRGFLSLAWSNLHTDNSAYTGFSFLDPAGKTSSAGISDSGLLSGQDSGEKLVGADTYATTEALQPGYYYIGKITLETNVSQTNVLVDGANVTFNSNIYEAIDVRYRGNALKIYDVASNNQTGFVDKDLPKPLSVIVVDGATGTPVPESVPITFTIVEPSNGAKFANGLTTINELTQNGVAGVKLTLGSVPGAITVTATCPDATCTSGAKEVLFSENAVTTKDATRLTSEICEMSGIVGKELPNDFKVYAQNTVSNEKEKDFGVSFTLLTAPREGAEIIAQSNITDEAHNYFATARLKLGKVEKRYTVRAYCADCLAGQEVLCYGFAHDRDIPIETDEESMANPDSRDPDTNEPLTPVVRVKKIAAQNDPENANSFTTYETENQVTLEAEVLPADWAQGAVVSWTLDDSPADNFITPLPSNLPAAGVRSGFSVDVKNPADGVPAPFRYRIVANAAKAGKDVSSKPRAIKQDEIDKCRQEYIDLSNPEKSEDLTASKYFSKYARSEFTLGVDGEKDPDYVKYISCLAHVFPKKADVVVGLANNPQIKFKIDVTSGYRSPIKNAGIGGVWDSSHLFGEGLDIVPEPASPENFKILWENTDCPKILERPGVVIMAVCKTGEETPRFMKGYSELNMYKLANCVHVGD